MNARQIIIGLGKELSELDDKALDLWTWLPSYKAAKAAHGDYADEFMPSIVDIMKEACDFISDGLTTKSDSDLYKCPCGHKHGKTQE